MIRSGDTFIVDQCVVIGWGKESFGASGISAVLKKIRVNMSQEISAYC